MNLRCYKIFSYYIISKSSVGRIDYAINDFPVF